MIFEQIPVGQMQNFSYLIGDGATKEAAIVDPGWDIEKILKISKKHDLNVKYILVTHSHYDHIQQVKELFDATDTTVYVHEEDSEEIKNKAIEKIKTVGEGDTINIGKIKVKVLHTPGHTPGSVCYLMDKKLITGDTLFVGNIGRTDLPGGSPRIMSETLRRLKRLDENIEVWPGHNYGSRKSSTIGREKKQNPHMAMLEQIKPSSCSAPNHILAIYSSGRNFP